jgi:hypothetical protein
MKEILKPNLAKIALALFLLIASSLLWRSLVISRISDTFPMGFPLQFYLAWGPYPPGENCSESNGLFFALDVLIWYIVSAFIISRIQKR